MSFKLKKGIFNIKCDELNCKFNIDVDVKQNVLGITEEDVEKEAEKFAGTIAKLKHDADPAIEHTLKKTLIEKKSCICEALKTSITLIKAQDEAIKYLEYKEGEIIINKEDVINFVCEVVKGSAFSTQNKNKIYKVGDNFGAYHLLINQKKNADIIAGEEGATIAFYDLKELSIKDPNKTKELYQKSMDDILQCIYDMENLINDLQLRVESEEISKNNLKEKNKIYEKKLKEFIKG